MALIDGDDFVSGDLDSFQQNNRMKNNWRQADPTNVANLSNPQPGMIVSDSDDDKLYHRKTASWGEIIQTATPVTDDAQIIGGDNSDAILILYEETTNDAVIWGLPVSPKRGLIFCDVADIAANFTGFITAHAQPTVFWSDLDVDSYLAIGHSADDFPDIYSNNILNLQYEANAGVDLFANSASSETQELRIFGFRAADALRSLEIGVGVDAADTASFDGVSNFYFDGDMGVGVLPTVRLHVSEPTDTAIAILETLRSGAVGGFIDLKHLSATPDNADSLVNIRFDGYNDNVAPEEISYVSIFTYSDDISDGSEDGGMEIFNYIDGVDTSIIRLRGGNVGIRQTTFGTNAIGVLALGTDTPPTTSPADCYQMWSADVLGVAEKAGPHWRSEEDGMYAWHGGAGTINCFTYQADVADDGTFTLPAITDSAWGFCQAGDNEEYVLFTVDDDGDVTLISNSANVVANADTDTNLCIGTAATQEPLTIKNRLGDTKNINLIIWYS